MLNQMNEDRILTFQHASVGIDMYEITGWADPVGRLEDVRVALNRLAHDSRPLADRLEGVTLCFLAWDKEEMPAVLRPVLQRITDARTAVRSHMGDCDHFAFEQLGTPALVRLTDDILCLCQACLIDCGKAREELDFVYPDTGSWPHASEK